MSTIEKSHEPDIQNEGITNNEFQLNINQNHVFSSPNSKNNKKFHDQIKIKEANLKNNLLNEIIIELEKSIELFIKTIKKTIKDDLINNIIEKESNNGDFIIINYNYLDESYCKNCRLKNNNKSIFEDFEKKIKKEIESLEISSKNIIEKLKNEIKLKQCVKLVNENGKLLKMDNVGLLNKLIGFEKKLSHLYTASQSDFSSLKFHNEVDKNNSLSILIKTNNNCTFGFNTTKSFNPSYSKGKFIKDENAFLFSLEINGRISVEKYPINPLFKDSAIFTDNNIFFALGEGYDLYIPDKCNSNSCTSDFINSYLIDNNEMINAIKSFKVIELEAYLIEQNFC